MYTLETGHIWYGHIDHLLNQGPPDSVPIFASSVGSFHRGKQWALSGHHPPVYSYAVTMATTVKPNTRHKMPEGHNQGMEVSELLSLYCF